VIRSPLKRYIVAVLLTALAVVARMALNPLLSEGTVPFITMFATVVLVGWYAGLGPALVSLILGAVAAVYLIIPSARELGMDAEVTAGLMVYLVMGSSCAVLGDTVHRARRQAEENAQLAGQQHQRLTEILGSITDAFFGVDKNWHFVFLNEKAVQRTGRNDLVGKNMWEEFRESVGTEAYAQLHRAMAQRVSVEYEVFDQQRQCWFREKAYPTADGGLAIYSQDITERKWFAEVLREEQLASIFNVTGVGMAQTDPVTRRYVRVNAALCRITGYSEAELLAMTVDELNHPDDRERDRKLFERLSPGESTYEIEKHYVRKDGTIISVLVTGNLVCDPRGRPVRVFAIIQDVSRRRQAEEALRKSEERLRLATLTGKVGLWEWDILNNHVTWTESLYGIHGLEHEEFIPTVEGFAALVHPDDRDFVAKAIERTLASGAPYELTFRAIKPGGQVIWLFTNASVLRDGAKPVRMVGATADVTELKGAEETLRQSDRRKDEFLATLAHELRNPLAPIRNGLRILRLGRANSAGHDQILEMMERQLSNLVRLVDDLLEVSRITSGKIELRKETVDLAAVVRSAVETVGPLVESRHQKLDVRLSPEPVLLEADAVRLAQVVANLLNNAAKYTEEGGQICLTAQREGDTAMVRVRDTGAGIPAEMLPQVFGLFMQTDRTMGRSQGGLGIGLPLVKSLVQLHGGSVEAHSEGPGRGSEFVIRLPLTGADVRLQRQEKAGSDKPAAGFLRRRMLVADDNRDAADSLGMLLGLMGAEVYTAYDGPSALEVIRVHRPAIVFLDLGMPGMDGCAVAAKIRQEPEFRDITLIALTGWGREEDRRRSLEAGFDHHVTKPPEAQTIQTLLASLEARVHSSRP
jgi:PAS domain S-box-containing protein